MLAVSNVGRLPKRIRPTVLYPVYNLPHPPFPLFLFHPNALQDTNTFLSDTPALLALSVTFSLVIPLTVVGELRGLAKGNKGIPAHLTGHLPTLSLSTSVASNLHAERNALAAQKSLQLLDAAFNARNPRLMAVTSQGSTLRSISYKMLAPEDATNDDAILSACVRHSAITHSRHNGQPDAHGRVLRTAVLLTSDRNLQVRLILMSSV